MNENQSDTQQRSPGPLRAFNLILTVVGVILVAVTGFFLPLGALVVLGEGSIDLPVTLEPPYTIVLDGHWEWNMTEGGPERIYPAGTPADIVEISPSSSELGDPSVALTASIPKDDRFSRSVLVAAAAVLLGAIWCMYVNARRIVRSAMDGDPFQARNVRRLQVVATAIIVSPFVWMLAQRIVAARFSTSPPVNVLTPGIPWWAVGVGVGVLALAEVFRAGTNLRDLERSTI